MAVGYRRIAREEMARCFIVTACRRPLLSDIEMPGPDGYELAFEVRSDPRRAEACLILPTSLSDEISVEPAHQIGAHEALTKFEANELIRPCCTVPGTMTTCPPDERGGPQPRRPLTHTAA